MQNMEQDRTLDLCCGVFRGYIGIGTGGGHQDEVLSHQELFDAIRSIRMNL